MFWAFSTLCLKKSGFKRSDLSGPRYGTQLVPHTGHTPSATTFTLKTAPIPSKEWLLLQKVSRNKTPRQNQSDSRTFWAVRENGPSRMSRKGSFLHAAMQNNPRSWPALNVGFHLGWVDRMATAANGSFPPLATERPCWRFEHVRPRADLRAKRRECPLPALPPHSCKVQHDAKRRHERRLEVECDRRQPGGQHRFIPGADPTLRLYRLCRGSG